ncbi:MAG: hypothetical protein MK081_14830 [Flavobacteriales bacterium]|nr:hypothetical protein [Flavobacteriales bacterium]
MKGKILSVLMSAVMVLAFSGEGVAQKWERLGSRKVNFGIERDVIQVGAHEGSFNKLKIAVTGGSINMRRMVVTYMNGSKEEIDLRHNFSRNSASRTVDLNGKNRKIKNIQFIYDTKNRSKKKAKIHVYGRS